MKQIKVGHIARVLYFDENAEIQVHIVSQVSGKLDKSHGRTVSAGSPVGQALLGKTIGDVVEITTPGGDTIAYEVLDILDGNGNPIPDSEGEE